MNQFQVFHFVIILIFSSPYSLTEALRYAKRGCKETCGGVTIPYPFGIGANCSINEWYVIDCNSSRPYLSAFNNNVEVTSINLEKQTVLVNVSNMITDWQNPITNSNDILISSNQGIKSPFLLSKVYNTLIFEGCGNAVIKNDGNIVSGCSSTCHNDTVSNINNCFGIGCCQATVPYNLDSFTLNLTCLERSGVCRSTFLYTDNALIGGTFSKPRYIPWDVGSTSISLLWTLTDDDYHELEGCSVNKSMQVDIGYGLFLVVRRCLCDVESEGNPYLDGGCEVPEYCEKCVRSGGRCVSNRAYFDEAKVTWGTECVHETDIRGSNNKISEGVILGVSISMGLLFMVLISCALYKVVQKMKVQRRKERFFKRNGGLLLKQQEAVDASIVDHKTLLFTAKELEKATDHFNDNRILGRGGQGTVYKGMLVDGRIVAVKKSKVVDESQLKQFINEVVVLSQVNHRNVVKLLGFCLETEVPLLVSEFIPNGTLYDLIHQDDTDEFPLSFNMRLQIATEIAGALSYLHSATSIPIYHRDVKTTNILLDEKYRAKVSDFGTSRFVNLDQTHLTTVVKGTFGYFDPEYYQSSRFTEKSDVYSFGVVLLELLTREKPVSLTRFGDETNSLVMHFMLAMEEDRVMSIFDAMIVKEDSRDELLAMANLAMRCLNFNGKFRPTMKEVAIGLEGMRMSHVPSTINTNLGHVNYYGEDQMRLTYEGSTSTTMSFKAMNDSTR